jgi:CheY-like chemotaxis protein
VSDHIPPQILHVDDEPDMLEQVREYLEGESIEGWGRPTVHGISSFDEALQALEERRVDLLILDVRLGGHGQQDVAPDEEEGIRTLRQIRERRFVPVIFWTNLPGKVEDLEGPLVRIGNKTADLATLANSVRALFGTGLPNVNRALRHLIEDEQRRYMWDFVAEHWDELRSDGDPMGLAYLLVRRLGRSLAGPGMQYVADELGAGGPGAPAPGTIQAAEMYIVPPFRDGQDAWWFVLTPSCDLERPEKNAANVLLAACQHAADDPRIHGWIANESEATKRKVRELVSHKTGGQDDRWLYLPAAPTIPDLVVDFQRLRSVAHAEFSAMRRVGSLASPFAESAINRFGRYYGRVGTDDLDVDALMTRLRTLHEYEQ